MKEVNKGIRILNLIIDYISVLIFSGLLIIVTGLDKDSTAILLIIYLLYYLIFESVSRRTLGKIITGTVVVNSDNSKPGLKNILLRSLLRFNPFDIISYLFGFEQGTHDKLSGTRLRYLKE
jgi:uncharacterized RDD family membrane protein YckC